MSAGRRTALALRAGIALALLVAGAAVGLASVVSHGRVLGLVLAVVATTATALAIPGGWDTRLPFCLGWVAIVYVAARPRPEGDYLVAADLPGYLLLGFGVAILLLGTTTARRRAARPAPTDDDRTASGVAAPS